MKRTFTKLGMFLMLGVMISFAAQAQNAWSPKKNSLPQEIIDKVFEYTDNPLFPVPGLPQKTHEYMWDANTWNLYMYYETSYFPNGFVHVETTFDASLAPLERSTYTYNASWQLTEILGESHETGTWELMSKFTLSYDAHGNLYELMVSYWTGASWMVAYGARTTYSYTGPNYVSAILYQSYDFFSGWQYYLNDIYTLAGNGYPTEILTQSYNGGWVDSTRYVNIDWYQYDPYSGFGAYEYYEEQHWDGGQWNPYLKESNVYDPNGGWVMTQQIYDGGWINYIRETMTMNDQGLPVNYKHEDWAGGVWVMITGINYLYTFSGENLTEEIIQAYNPQTQNYENVSRYVYSDFFYPTGQEEIAVEQVLGLYPNPVTTELNVSILKGENTNWHLEIFNLTGQRVLSQVIDSGITRIFSIPVSMLPKGHYLLQLTSGTERYSKTFLKE